MNDGPLLSPSSRRPTYPPVISTTAGRRDLFHSSIGLQQSLIKLVQRTSSYLFVPHRYDVVYLRKCKEQTAISPYLLPKYQNKTVCKNYKLHYNNAILEDFCTVTVQK